MLVPSMEWKKKMKMIVVKAMYLDGLKMRIPKYASPGNRFQILSDLGDLFEFCSRYLLMERSSELGQPAWLHLTPDIERSLIRKFSQAEHKYLHKDLRKLLGPYTGFHITPGTTNPDLFFEHNNCSSWYNEPFIIPARDAHSELISFVSMIDQEYERAAATENGYAQGSDIDSDASSNYDQTKNILQRPRSQLAGQALIQYLLFKGIPIHEVAEMLGSLDETFLYKSESRWWNGYRVPQHTQLNDKIVEKVLVIAKAGKEWWEEEYDFQGKRMPKEQVLIHRRMRERKAARFAKMTVENYLWWRLMGQQPHKDVKSGAMMRIGEY
jgi:hypothetical protein